MRKRSLYIKSCLISMLIIIFLLTGCGQKMQTSDTGVEESQVTALSSDEMFTKRDLETAYDSSAAVTIQLKETGISASSDSVQIEDHKITIREEGVYLLSGQLNQGMIIVDADENAKIQLVFQGVEITCDTSAPLYIKNADKVFLTLEEGTENCLRNTGDFVAIDENNIDGAIFSKSDLTLNGKGSLCVKSESGHGLVCKDDLVLVSENLEIEAAGHGIDANDSVRIANSKVSIIAGRDGIKADNDEDDAKGFIYIESGSFDITTGGGYENGTKKSGTDMGMPQGGGMRGPGRDHQAPPSGNGNQNNQSTEEETTSMKGIKASSMIQILNGSFVINSADDSIHSNSVITIFDGTFDIKTGDDGIHADETVTIQNGEIVISESYEGLEARDIFINDGQLEIHSTDDGINAAEKTDKSNMTNGRDGMFGGGPMGMQAGNCNITISGGKIKIYASGDGIDANGSLSISGGEIYLSGPIMGDTSILDYDTTGEITGGIFIGTGSANMAQNFSSYSQGVIFEKVEQGTAGSTIKVLDENDQVILEYVAEQDFQLVIISHPDLSTDKDYTLLVL